MAFPNLRKAIDVFSSDCLIFVSVELESEDRVDSEYCGIREAAGGVIVVPANFWTQSDVGVRLVVQACGNPDVF